MRVRFNPLALLLDASLEGEYDLVQRIIYEVRMIMVRGSDEEGFLIKENRLICII